MPGVPPRSVRGSCPWTTPPFRYGFTAYAVARGTAKHQSQCPAVISLFYHTHFERKETPRKRCRLIPFNPVIPIAWHHFSFTFIHAVPALPSILISPASPVRRLPILCTSYLRKPQATLRFSAGLFHLRRVFSSITDSHHRHVLAFWFL